LAFGAPVFAWGGYFYGAETGELVNIVLTSSGGSQIATVPVTVNTGFFGFVMGYQTGLKQITFASRIQNPIPSVGQGFGLENVVGAYVVEPTLVPSGEIVVTGSGLAYSRVTKTFNATVTIKNTGTSAIGGPLQIAFQSLPSGVTVVGSPGTFKGNPYITVNVTSLTPGQSTTANVQFSNPSNATISVSPAIYSGGFSLQ
jgi:hypothetical protein